MVVGRGREEGDMGSCSSMGIKTPCTRWVSSRDVLYNTVLIIKIYYYIVL